MKRLAATILLGVLVFCLAGCSKQPEAISDDIRSGQIQIDGIIYTFPLANLKELTKNGWIIDETDDYMETVLAFRQHSANVKLVNEAGDILRVQVFTHESKGIKLKDAKVWTVSVSSGAVKSGIDIVFPGGLRFGTRYDDAVSVWGEPDEQRDWDEKSTSYYVYYYTEIHNVILVFDKETHELQMFKYEFTNEYR